MKSTVHLTRGLHLTATDKRNILATIAHLEKGFAAFVKASPQTMPNYTVISASQKVLLQGLVGRSIQQKTLVFWPREQPSNIRNSE